MNTFISSTRFQSIRQFIQKPELSSAILVIGTRGIEIFLRLVSTIILTRLLSPSVFGEILIVTTISSAIVLFSEVGLRGSIINNNRGNSDSNYVNTIWTLYITQHIAIAAALIGASFFSEKIYPAFDNLSFYLQISAVIALVSGFNSTKLFQLEKKLDMTIPCLFVVGKRFLGLIFAILLCYSWPSASSILFADLIATVFFVALSHRIGSGTKNRIHIDRVSFKEVFNYGKWILPTTGVTWITREGNKLTLTFILTTTTLGFFSVASNVGLIFCGIAQNLSDKWLFPVYTKYRESKNIDLIAIKIRSMILIGSSIGIALLCAGSNIIVDLVYEEEYAAVGPILATIAAGSVGLIVANCYLPIFKAHANSRALFKVRIVQSILLASAMLLGYLSFGTSGLILGVSYSQLLFGIFAAFSTRHYFTKKLFLLDSIIITIPFGLWLLFLFDELKKVF
ncbi:oligosaccharide flippase family protein [Microbulbifer aggregans]|uniref:oligosaccharide flippase family protein n=1 Tax=Microbulbifer aggregans TaxID=1769779 RepID=UPI001CFF4DCD|nr:oligosaccharide flippase family protein [Microbulbifer aggregans]